MKNKFLNFVKSFSTYAKANVFGLMLVGIVLTGFTFKVTGILDPVYRYGKGGVEVGYTFPDIDSVNTYVLNPFDGSLFGDSLQVMFTMSGATTDTATLLFRSVDGWGNTSDNTPTTVIGGTTNVFKTVLTKRALTYKPVLSTATGNRGNTNSLTGELAITPLTFKYIPETEFKVKF